MDIIFAIVAVLMSTNLMKTEASSLSSPPTEVSIFEPNVLTDLGNWTFTPTFSQDGRTAVFVKWDDPDLSAAQRTIQYLVISSFENGVWTPPLAIEQTKGYRVDWPHFSPDGRYFYLSFAKPHSNHYGYPAVKGFDDFDIWRAECSPSGNIDWSTFQPLQCCDINRKKTPANSRIGYVHNETGPRTDRSGNLYFWTERLDDGGGRRDLYLAKREGDSWSDAILLPEPVNSRYRESGLCISKNGRWMIFSSENRGGVGGKDLYFTQKDAAGQWSAPINLGPEVNSRYDEVVPELSPDNHALFFTSERPIEGVDPPKDGDGAPSYNAVYWVAIASLDLPIKN